jgi:aspartyl-tRNA(Asn)/glutamyl-tRNA(Gln) amidotransferase subunit B
MSSVTTISPQVLAQYEAVIGLEVHVQLLTQSKIFCSCSTRFGDPPNSNTCPVCLGLPGALPVLNREAVVMAMKAAMALNCTIHPRSRFARKNYFYPDLPKGYQISQYDEPLASGGWLDIEVDGKAKRIGVTRVHLEEDAGKSLHEGFPDSDHKSYIDLNRSGVPLIEIVGEPDLRTPEEAYDYLTRLKTLMLYLEVSNCNMEEGSLRCDANVSVRRAGASAFGTKIEVKNLNSFKFLQKALAHEIERQIGVLEQGQPIALSTLGWDSRQERTYDMRSKELAHDYRYFPEPDLLPLVISAERKEEVRRSMPELPEAKKARFVREYGLAANDATLLTAARTMADYFEGVVKARADAKIAANWLLNEYPFLLQKAGRGFTDYPVSEAHFAELVSLLTGGTVSGPMAKEVLGEMIASGKRASEIIAAKGLEQINDPGRIAAVVREIMAANPKQVEQYRGGKAATRGWFVGQVMKATKGQANPQLVQEVLKKELGP